MHYIKDIERQIHTKHQERMKCEQVNSIEHNHQYAIEQGKQIEADGSDMKDIICVAIEFQNLP